MLRPLAAVAAIAALATMTACGASSTPDTASSAPNTTPAAPSAAAVAQAAADRSVADVLPGTITYFTFNRGETIRVNRYSGGSGQFLDFGAVRAGDVAGHPSPDGRRFALISSPDRGSVKPGDLVVAEPGGARRVLARNVAWGGGIAPFWTPDGQSIVVGNTRYNVATGAAAPAGLTAANAGYLVYSDNGRVRAYARTETEIQIDTRTVSIAHLPQCDQEPACPFAVQAVSNDGRYVALGRGNSDPGHTYTTTTVLDTRTGQVVAKANVEGLLHVWFTGTGAVVHTSNAVHIYDAAWTRTATFLAPQNSTDTDKVVYHS
jgi:hypothetical protein